MYFTNMRHFDPVRNSAQKIISVRTLRLRLHLFEISIENFSNDFERNGWLHWFEIFLEKKNVDHLCRLQDVDHICRLQGFDLSHPLSHFYHLQRSLLHRLLILLLLLLLILGTPTIRFYTPTTSTATALQNLPCMQ